jgi:predicted acylesterase/phospholipase RssA
LIESFQTLIFAGGGNRCWWQAGLLHEWMRADQVRAKRFVGTSAGAAIAYAAATNRLPDAFDACKRAYAANEHIIKSRIPLRFAHETIYPAWLRAFVHDASVQRLRERETPTVMVAFAHLPRWLPTSASLALGAACYIIDKYWSQRIHPALLPRLGYSMQVRELVRSASSDEANALLAAAAAAPPFMPALRVEGRIAVDGGFADNAPRVPVNNDRQLVLLTRHYPNRPQLFEMDGRWYFQPTRAIPVSTWDCTPKATVEAAFELGRADAAILTV